MRSGEHAADRAGAGLVRAIDRDRVHRTSRFRRRSPGHGHSARVECRPEGPGKVVDGEVNAPLENPG